MSEYIRRRSQGEDSLKHSSWSESSTWLNTNCAASSAASQASGDAEKPASALL